MFYNDSKLQENKQSEKNLKIQEIYKDEMNNECFDCGKLNPEFISANNGIFICKDCMEIHYQFSDEVSLIIKNNLFLLNEEQINYIYYGGNRKLLEFINYKFPRLQNCQPQILYKTQAMQYYRDNLYYLVEGGNKPIKPTENCAYNLIPNLDNYALNDKIENNNININYNINNRHNTHKIKRNIEREINDEKLEEEEDDIDNNFNIRNYYTTQNQLSNDNNIVFGLPYNNSFVYSKYKKNQINHIIDNDNDENSEDKSDYKNDIVRTPENTTYHNINSSKNNFYQKRDTFFKEMNRLFGGSGLEDEEGNFDQDERNIKISAGSDIESKNPKKNYQGKNRNKTYKVKRPRGNYNYNNYIKNTININNNNTNIFLDEDGQFNSKLLSKSQIMNISHDNIKKTKNKTINYNSTIQSKKKIYNSNTYKIQQIYQNHNKNKLKIHIPKNIYIKPILASFNASNYKTPSLSGYESNISSVHNSENLKNKNQYLLNSNNDKDNIENIEENENKFTIQNTLSSSPHYFSPKEKNSQQNNSPNIFNKKYSNYSLTIQNNSNYDVNNNNNNIHYNEVSNIPMEICEQKIININIENNKEKKK